MKYGPDPIQCKRLDGTEVAVRFWGTAGPPMKETRSRHFLRGPVLVRASARDFGLPKGGADYRWVVTLGDSPEYVLAASPKAEPLPLIEIPLEL